MVGISRVLSVEVLVVVDLLILVKNILVIMLMWLRLLWKWLIRVLVRCIRCGVMLEWFIRLLVSMNSGIVISEKMFMLLKKCCGRVLVNSVGLMKRNFISVVSSR